MSIEERRDAAHQRRQLVLTWRLTDRRTYAEIGRKLGVSTARAQRLFCEAIRLWPYLIRQRDELLARHDLSELL